MPVSRRISARPSREACSSIRIRIARPSFRPRASGRAVLTRIEEQASREGLALMRLETGIHQAEALALYRRAGYAERGPFGEYASDPLSHFMEKRIDPRSKPLKSKGR